MQSEGTAARAGPETGIGKLKAANQNKARVLGISSQDLAGLLNNSLSGHLVTYYRERDKQIELILHGAADERAKMSFLKDLAIPTPSGRAVPIAQIAEIHDELDDGIIWRRNRLPIITVRSDVRGDAQGPDVANAIEKRLGGLATATGLTLLFLPALNALWFRVQPDVVAPPVAAA